MRLSRSQGEREREPESPQAEERSPKQSWRSRHCRSSSAVGAVASPTRGPMTTTATRLCGPVTVCSESIRVPASSPGSGNQCLSHGHGSWWWRRDWGPGRFQVRRAVSTQENDLRDPCRRSLVAEQRPSIGSIQRLPPFLLRYISPYLLYC